MTLRFMTGGKCTALARSAWVSRDTKAWKCVSKSSNTAPRPYRPGTPHGIKSPCSTRPDNRACSACARVVSCISPGMSVAFVHQQQRCVRGVDAVVADHQDRGVRVAQVPADALRGVVAVASDAAQAQHLADDAH